MLMCVNMFALIRSSAASQSSSLRVPPPRHPTPRHRHSDSLKHFPLMHRYRGMHLRNVAAVCLGADILLLWIRESTFVELNNGSFKSWTNYVYVNACGYNEYYFGARVSRRVPSRSRPLRDVNFIRLTDPRYGSAKRNKDIPPRETCGATKTRWLRTGGHRTARYTSATRVERRYGFPHSGF